MRIKVVMEPSDEGGYTVYVPSLPGCISEGNTAEEALNNIHEAMLLYLEEASDDGVYGFSGTPLTLHLSPYEKIYHSKQCTKNSSSTRGMGHCLQGHAPKTR